MEGHKVELLSKIVHEGMSSEAFEDQVFEIDQADQEVNIWNKRNLPAALMANLPLGGLLLFDEWIMGQQK